MRRLPPRILALTLAAAVALSATPALARRKAAAPPVKSLLTTDESDCKAFGTYYYWLGKERDVLIPITTTIDDARRTAVRAAPNDPTLAAHLTEELLAGVHYVYAHPEHSPAKLRYLVELQCLKSRQDAAPAPADAGRTAAPPPVRSLVTTDEQACKFWCDTYFWMATDRDALIPITTTIDKARKWAASFVPQDPTTAAKLAEHLVNAVRRVYAAPDVSPAQARYIAELRCIQKDRADDTVPAATGPWR